eukprot:9351291-Alexandrium_andersonii.AAC.1
MRFTRAPLPTKTPLNGALLLPPGPVAPFCPPVVKYRKCLGKLGPPSNYFPNGCWQACGSS